MRLDSLDNVSVPLRLEETCRVDAHKSSTRDLRQIGADGTVLSITDEDR